MQGSKREHRVRHVPEIVTGYGFIWFRVLVSFVFMEFVIPVVIHGTIGNRDIGRYIVLLWGGLPGFETVIISATFHCMTCTEVKSYSEKLRHLLWDLHDNSMNICTNMSHFGGFVYTKMFVNVLITCAGVIGWIILSSCWIFVKIFQISGLWNWKIFSEVRKFSLFFHLVVVIVFTDW